MAGSVRLYVPALPQHQSDSERSTSVMPGIVSEERPYGAAHALPVREVTGIVHGDAAREKARRRRQSELREELERVARARRDGGARASPASTWARPRGARRSRPRS
jgi:hypothetical protein